MFKFEIETTETYDKWLSNLKDRNASTYIQARMYRVRKGNFGNVEPVGEGISELKIDYGPGYRIYFIKQGRTIILLLCGGDKKTQKKDIKRAKEMLKCLQTNN